MSVIPSYPSTPTQCKLQFWETAFEQDSLKFPRHFHPWKNSVIWIGTLRDLPKAGKSLWNQNVLRRRSSHRSGRIRQPCSASAWWEPCGLTGWPTPCGREWACGRPGEGVEQPQHGQTSRAERRGLVFLVMGAFVPTSKIPWGLLLCLPYILLISIIAGQFGKRYSSISLLRRMLVTSNVTGDNGSKEQMERSSLAGRTSLSPQRGRESERWVGL